MSSPLKLGRCWQCGGLQKDYYVICDGCLELIKRTRITDGYVEAMRGCLDAIRKKKYDNIGCLELSKLCEKKGIDWNLICMRGGKK